MFKLSDAKGKEKLAWTWKNGAVSPSTLGNPDVEGGTAYAMCVYSGSTLAFSANVPAGLLCGLTASCWDVRDDRATFFIDSMSPGIYHFRYLARATTRGRFVIGPTKAEEMYAPEVFGRTAARTFTVR